MATAKKLPSGRWRIQPSKKLDNGTLLRTSITADDKKEAERLAAIWIAEQDANQGRSMTLGEAIDLYIDSCEKSGNSPTTIKEYSSRRKSSFPDIINYRLDKLTPALIQQQINSRLETVSIKTVRNDFYLLKPVLSLYGPQISLSRIKIGKKAKRKKLRMKEEWKVKIPSKIAELYGKSDFYFYVFFLIFAGIRPSEAFALTWGDLSPAPETRLFKGQKFSVGYITINKARIRTKDSGYKEKDPKTEAGTRVLELDWSFFNELYSVRPRGNDEEKVFKINPYCNDRKWKSIKRALNLPEELRQYDLRHFHATDIAYSGASEEEIMERLGHSSSSFSHSVYIEIFEEHEAALNASLSVRTAQAIKDIAP